MMPPPSVPPKKLTKPRTELSGKLKNGGSGGDFDENDDGVELDDLLETLREQKHDDDDYDESQVRNRLRFFSLGMGAHAFASRTLSTNISL